MKDKKIIVAVKYCGGDLNPFDGAALECALASGCEHITAVTMAPPGTAEKLSQLTRLGVRAVLLTDPAYAGADTLATAKTLAAFIKKEKPDFVFCGRQSVDGDTAQVPPCLSVLLGFEIVPSVLKVAGNTVYLRDGSKSQLTGGQVVTFERMAALRFPSIRSKRSPVEIIGNNILQLPAEECGQNGSPTRVIQSFENTSGRRKCTFISSSELDKVIAESLQRERKALAAYGGPKLKKAFYIGNVCMETERIAECAEEIPAARKSAEEIAREIKECGAKIVLWSDEPLMRVLAPQVAGLLNAGLCADCTGLETDGERLIMIRPAAGGNITAKIECRAQITMATIRTAGGADNLVFSVGRGAENALEIIKSVAAKRNARLCCSRAVVDDGLLPYICQVGLTGQVVAPKVYVALGISGAVQHMCAVECAGTIIAVNRDKNARIFDFADYGILEDINNVEL